jgi:hypothetical protein
VRAGLSDVTVTVCVRSDVDDALLDELAQTTRRTSAVCDSLVNPVPMRLHVQRLPRRAVTGRVQGAADRKTSAKDRK